MPFDRFIGIDYSGAKAPQAGITGLRIYQATPHMEPIQVRPPNEGLNWSREQIAEWLIAELNNANNESLLVGIDHGFSFPQSYMDRYGLANWPEFLDDFCHHWPTHELPVKAIRQNAPQRTGNNEEFRLTERWTSSAKSVFQFDVPGSVASSTHAGIPWLNHIRQHCPVHIWPFDGWDLDENISVICEVYPSVFRNRFPREDRNGDEHDAYSVARWMQETQGRGSLENYFNPLLTEEERATAELEGWILGVL